MRLRAPWRSRKNGRQRHSILGSIQEWVTFILLMLIYCLPGYQSSIVSRAWSNSIFDPLSEFFLPHFPANKFLFPLSEFFLWYVSVLLALFCSREHSSWTVSCLQSLGYIWVRFVLEERATDYQGLMMGNYHLNYMNCLREGVRYLACKLSSASILSHSCCETNIHAENHYIKLYGG